MQLDIGELRLVGFALKPAERDALAAQVAVELEALIAAGGVPSHWRAGSVPRLPATPFSISDGTSPSETGRLIAGAIYAAGAP